MDLMFGRLFIYNFTVFLTIAMTYFLGKIYKQRICNCTEDVIGRNNFDLSKILIVGMPMFLLPALQYRVGIDYDSYINIFYTGGFKKDIFFGYIINGLHFITDNSQILFVFIAFFFVYLILYIVLRYSPYPCLSIFLLLATGWYTSYGFNLIRQGLAIAIVVFSYRFIFERAFTKYFICLLIAANIHFTSVIFFPAYWIYGFLSKRFLYLLLELSVCFVMFKNFIGHQITFLINLTSYGHYFDTAFFVPLEATWVLIAIYVLVLGSAVLFWKEEKKFSFYLTLQFIAFWSIFVQEYAPLFDRAVVYFQISLIFLLPEIASNIKLRVVKYGYLVGVVVCYMFLWLRNAESIARKYGVITFDGDYQTIFEIMDIF